MSEMPNSAQGAEAAAEGAEQEAPKGKLACICKDKGVMLAGLAIVLVLVGVIGICVALNCISNDVKTLNANMTNVQERVVELENCHFRPEVL